MAGGAGRGLRGEGWGRDRERIWKVERCWESRASIAEDLSTFIAFIQLQSLRQRTEAESLRSGKRGTRFCGVAGPSLLRKLPCSASVPPFSLKSPATGNPAEVVSIGIHLSRSFPDLDPSFSQKNSYSA